MKRVLTIAKEDTTKFWLAYTLSTTYGWTKPDSALLFAQQALQLSSQTHIPLHEALSKDAMGSSLWVLGDYLEADKFLLGVMPFYESEHRWDNVLGLCATIC